MNGFSVNQIVNGKHAGTFVILAFKKIGGEQRAILKEVNPANFTQTAPGQIALSLDCIKPIY
jgi:hypothetical protein